MRPLQQGRNAELPPPPTITHDVPEGAQQVPPLHPPTLHANGPLQSWVTQSAVLGKNTSSPDGSQQGMGVGNVGTVVSPQH